MPPFAGMPYGPAPGFCFPLTEIMMYLLFIWCMVYAAKKGGRHVSYLLGGVVFGLFLEYINVITNMGYVYGKFMIMLGQPPFDIPLCVGLGWGVIMYTARLFTDAFNLPLWSSAALDALLAISIDLSMDTVAYRLHMWHWDWSNTGLNPLTAHWFGVPYGNFFGWLCVVFFYSSSSRLFERWIASRVTTPTRTMHAVVPVLAVAVSQIVLFVVLKYVGAFLNEQFGITSKHRFISFLVILSLLVIARWRSRKRIKHAMPLVTWLVPVWFHVYFFIWLFAGGFYKENIWMTVAGLVNMIIGILIHWLAMKKGPRLQLQTVEAVPSLVKANEKRR